MTLPAVTRDNLGPITVHHFAPDPRRVGGIETVVSILVDRNVGADAAEYHRTLAHGSIRDNLVSLATITRDIFRLDRQAIVHVHLSQGGSFLREGWALVLAQARGLASVATIHGSRFELFAQKHPKVVRAVLGQADSITCLSDGVRDAVRDLIPSAPVTIVPNPVPSDYASPLASTTGETVLFAGEIGTRKGVDVLFRAWALVEQERPAATCLVVGPHTGLVVPPLARLTVMPPRTAPEVAAMIREARVIVLPSRNEGMPMILTEALAAGRPFVSTPVGGIPQLANGVQPLVAVGDHVALADWISRLLQSPELAQKLGEAGRAFHTESRSTKVIGETLRAIYTNL